MGRFRGGQGDSEWPIDPGILKKYSNNPKYQDGNEGFDEGGVEDRPLDTYISPRSGRKKKDKGIPSVSDTPEE